jgi:hypothetical protein
MRLLILFLNLMMSSAFAFTCKPADKVQPPPSTCSIFYEILGVNLKMCSGVLIAPDKVLTTSTCTGNTRFLTAKITCGTDSAIDGKSSVEDVTYRNVDKTDFLKPEDDDNSVHNMAVLTLARPSTMTPAIMEMDPSQFGMNECFVAGGGAEDIEQRTGAHKACKINEYGPFGRSRNTVCSELIAENGDLGGPMYCKNAKGDYVVRAIHHLNNPFTTFYERLDANALFLNPIMNGTRHEANPVVDDKTSPPNHAAR